MMKSTMFDKPDLVKASEPNRSTVSINELSDYTETARYNVSALYVASIVHLLSHPQWTELQSMFVMFSQHIDDYSHNIVIFIIS